MRFSFASTPPSSPSTRLFSLSNSATVIAVFYCALLMSQPMTMVSGFVPSSSASITTDGRFCTSKNNGKNHKFTNSRRTILKYNEGGDLSSDNHRKSDGRPTFNAWSVVSDTEAWISKILDGNNKKSGSDPNSNKSNPYTRKEVSFFCERESDSPMIVANVFRRLREIREQGEQHGKNEEKSAEKGGNMSDRTFRQTQVVVIPWNEKMNRSFRVFNNCVNAINEARRNSRDLVTDTSLTDKNKREWVVSVSSSHLHPDFEIKSPAQISSDTKKGQKEESASLQEYKKNRLLARQSPYPTIVMEVKSMPAPTPFPPTNGNEDERKEKLRREYEEFGTFLSKKEYSSNRRIDDINRKKLIASDVQKLESLFSKPAFIRPKSRIGENKEKTEKKEKEDKFYESIGKTDGIQELSSPATAISLAQNWVAKQLENNKQNKAVSCFTIFQASHTDEAFEFVFINLAMQLGIVESEIAKEKRIEAQRILEASSKYKQQSNNRCFRQYVVMPSFLPSSATSLEKFSNEVQKIIDVLPISLFNGSGNKINVSYFHPEHVDPNKRSPVPMISLQLQL